MEAATNIDGVNRSIRIWITATLKAVLPGNMQANESGCTQIETKSNLDHGKLNGVRYKVKENIRLVDRASSSLAKTLHEAPDRWQRKAVLQFRQHRLQERNSRIVCRAHSDWNWVGDINTLT